MAPALGQTQCGRSFHNTHLKLSKQPSLELKSVGDLCPRPISRGVIGKREGETYDFHLVVKARPG